MTKPDAAQTATTAEPKTQKPVQKESSPTTTTESATPVISPPLKKDPASAGVAHESKRNHAVTGTHKKELPRQAEKNEAPASTDVIPNEPAYTNDVVNSVAMETSTPQASAPAVAETTAPANAAPKKIMITITAAESEKYLDESATPAISPQVKKDPAAAGVALGSKRNHTVAGTPKKELPRQADRKETPASADVIPNEPAYTNDVVNSVAMETSTPQAAAPAVAETTAPANAAPKKIMITITAAESEKYLDKVALAEATSEEKKPSTFQKLLKKADDLKNNQDPFGELRQRKNEILALNFKNEKRGQNK